MDAMTTTQGTSITPPPDFPVIVMTVARPAEGTSEVAVPHCLRREPALSDAQIVALARTLEASEGGPVDLECAYRRGRFYLLQCRPITTLGG